MTKAEKAAQEAAEQEQREAAERVDFLERLYQMHCIAREQGHSILELLVAVAQDKYGVNIRYTPAPDAEPEA